MKYFYLYVAFLLSMTSCAVSEKKEAPPETTQFLHENQNAPQGITLNPQEKPTQLKGTVLSSDSIPTPLQNINLELFESSKPNNILATTSTHAGGKFVFAKVLKNGDYTIRAQNSKWKGFLSFTIDRYEVFDLIIELKN